MREKTMTMILAPLHATPGRPAHAGIPPQPGRGSYLGLGLETQTAEGGQINRLSGLRNGRIVEIRLYSGQIESATWLLTCAPAFDVVLGGWSTIPRFLADAIGDVPVTVPIWQGLHLYGSDAGLVAVRSADAPMPQAFMHDLWLLERIAARLGLLPLPAGDLAAVPIPSGRGLSHQTPTA